MITLLICSPVCKRTRFVLLGRSRQSTQDCSYRGKLKIIDYIYIHFCWLRSRVKWENISLEIHTSKPWAKYFPQGSTWLSLFVFILRPPLFRFLPFFLRFVSLKVTPFQNERVPPFIYGSKLNRSRYFTAKIFGVVPFHFKRKIYVTNVFSSINILNFMMIHNCSIIVICKILVFRIKMSAIEHRTDHMNS